MQVLWRPISTGNRTEWSQIRFINTRVSKKIGQPRSGSPIFQSRVWLQTELDDTKSYYHLVINITISKDLRKFKKLLKNSELYPFHYFVWNFGLRIILNFVTGSFKMKFSLRLVYLTVRLQTVWLRHRKPISRKYIVSSKDHVFSTNWSTN